MADTEDDGKATGMVAPGIRRAANVWLKYCKEAEVIVHLTHEGFSRVQMMPELHRVLQSLGEPDEKDTRTLELAEWKAAEARKEAAAGFPIVHAHSLLGLWGALECFVEDLFLAMLSAHPETLAGEGFRKVKVPAALLSAPQDDRNRALLTEAQRVTDADLALGSTKFERLLNLVGLGGSVPPPIRAAIFHAQQVRNVWAHRAGIADSAFVERCPDLGFGVGDRVNMSPDYFLYLMHGLHMYGAVIVNRYLTLEGRDPVSPQCVGYEGVLAPAKDDGSASAESGGDEAAPEARP